MLGGFERHADHRQIRMKSNQRKELRDGDNVWVPDPAVLAILNFSVTHKNKFPFLFKSVRFRLQSLAPCVSSGQ